MPATFSERNRIKSPWRLLVKRYSVWRDSPHAATTGPRNPVSDQPHPILFNVDQDNLQSTDKGARPGGGVDRLFGKLDNVPSSWGTWQHCRQFSTETTSGASKSARTLKKTRGCSRFQEAPKSGTILWQWETGRRFSRLLDEGGQVYRSIKGIF